MKKFISTILSMLMISSVVSFQVFAFDDASFAETPAQGDTAEGLTNEWYGGLNLVITEDGVDEAVITDDVLAVLEKYLALRELSFNNPEGKANLDIFANKAEAEKLFTERNADVDVYETNINSIIDFAEVTLKIEGAEVKDGVYTLAVYEWTFYDYFDKAGEMKVTDVSGYGVDHEMTLEYVDGKMVITADEYLDDTLNFDEFAAASSAEAAADAENDNGLLAEEFEADTNGEFIAGYNIGAAVAYSDAHWSSYNYNFYDFTPLGGDCANFVSQCLLAGGMPMHYGANYSSTCWFYNTSSNRSGSWTGAKESWHYWSTYRGNGIVRPGNGDVWIGCPVYVDWSSDGVIDHAYFCVGRNSAGTAIINSHTADKYHCNWNYGYSYSTYYTVQVTPVEGGGPVLTWRDEVAFDSMVYRDKHDDLKYMTDEELKNHWNEFGKKEGRCASTVLDLKYYVENNEDLKAAFGTDYAAAYEHFCENGYKEHRVSSRVFDGQYYCDNHPDVAEIYGDEYIRHYIEHGIYEGRKASKTFDVNYYLFTRPDVAETWPGDLAMATRHYAGHGVKEGKPGYDSTAPVFDDVVISDISSKGYTITATVTDDWGIDRVCFPTWSINNHQDDLREDWYDSCVGTKNGNTYTFVVKTSDHNNEIGLYSTHIYAYDLGGNKHGVAYDDIDVKDIVVEPSEIILKNDSAYVKDGASLKNVKPSTTVDSVLSQFENADLKVVGDDGNSVTASQNVGTGDKIQLYKSGEIVDSLTVIILGDIDGNGMIDSTDYIRVKANFLGTFSLDSNQKIAADVDLNAKIDSTDYMRIKGHFVKTFVIG